MRAPIPLDPTVLGEIEALANRRLSREELAAAMSIPLSPDEIAETLALADWFCRRYKTGAERLAYVRTAYRRWSGKGPPRS